MGSSANLDKIGTDIGTAIRALNTGANPPANSPEKLRSFLKTPRGLSLVFWAMNETWKQIVGRNVFRVDIGEWEKDEPVDWCKVKATLNCHTHYIEPGDGKPGIHWAPQYQSGAHNHWWLFPDAYDFWFENGMVKNRLRLGYPIHAAIEYCEHMSQAYAACDRKTKFLIMPAPGPSGDLMDGSIKDAASQADMRRTAQIMNRLAGEKICRVAGIIQQNDDATLIPEIERNPSRVWKIYPHPNWTPETKKWLTNHLPKALKKLAQSNLKHTVCIHFWDGDLSPSPELKLVDEYKTAINFVLFHACYPNHHDLASLLKGRVNIYAEIGGTLANQILGSYGQDSITPKAPTADAGIPSAQEMLQALRGIEPLGENDGQIVFGTDAIWHGSPIWQVEAFKRLIIDEDVQREIAFKRKVLYENTRRAFPTLK